jgi:probable F420-dependent oxidoreductase
VGDSVGAEVATLARRAEALGYATLVVGEHVSLGTLLPGLLAPIATLMAAAAATTSLRVASHVFTAGLRHPALLAQEAATIDLLSGGRLELGLGAGWWRRDYDALGLPFPAPGDRVAQLAEAVALIKRLWSEEVVTQVGPWYRVQNLALRPPPVQRPHPPLFIGGGSRRLLTLAAREADIVGLDLAATADGSLDLATGGAAATARKVDWVREAAGGRFDTLELNVLVHHVMVTTERMEAARRIAAWWAEAPVHNRDLSREQVLSSPHALVGTVEQIVADLHARRDQFAMSYVTVMAEHMEAFAPVVAQLRGT